MSTKPCVQEANSFASFLNRWIAHPHAQGHAPVGSTCDRVHEMLNVPPARLCIGAASCGSRQRLREQTRDGRGQRAHARILQHASKLEGPIRSTRVTTV